MILSSAFRASSSSDKNWSPFDDRWYQPDMGLSAYGGGYFSPETMFRCSTVLAAVRFLCVSVGLCRAQIIRYDGASRRPDPNHYAQRLLRRPYYPRHTDFEWLELNVLWHSIWGNSYNRILKGTDGPLGGLKPLEPWRMKPVDTDSQGGLVYRYTPKTGKPELLAEEELLRFPGISTDGIEGAAMYQLMRNVVNIALLAERHTSQFLSKGARIGGVLVPKSPLEEDQRKDLVDSWNESVGGPDKTGTIALVPYGVEFAPFTQSNRDSQLIELNDNTVGHILRFLNVPGVVVGFAEKTATYASAEAFFEKGGIKHCILPLITRFERRIEHSLIFEEDVVCKFNLDALMRADLEKRYAALFRATGRPWMTGNEARAKEDMNPADDPGMNEVAMPTNLTTQDMAADSTGSTKVPSQALKSAAVEIPPDTADQLRESQVERGRRLAVLAATRLVRRELVAIKDRVPLAARDLKAWRAWVVDYYGRHVETVAREMDVTDEVASQYAFAQRDSLLAEGLGVTESWEQTAVPKLAALAFGD